MAEPGIPAAKNWAEMFSSRVCLSSIPGAEKFSYTIHDLPASRICITEVTQAPGFVNSAVGIQTQTLQPSVLGCTITGSIDELGECVDLIVTCDKDIQVLVWWPNAWGIADIFVNGMPIPDGSFSALTFGSEDFVCFPIDEGIGWSVVVE